MIPGCPRQSNGETGALHNNPNRGPPCAVSRYVTADASLALLALLTEAGAHSDPERTSVLSRARAGEREAFGELLAPHLPMARRVALAAVGRHADADEAVQEASIAAWRHLGSLSNEAAFRAWFLRIVWRKALD